MSKEQLAIVAVVMLVAICPTAIDAYRAWDERPELRHFILSIYIITFFVVAIAWRMWDGGKV